MIARFTFCISMMFTISVAALEVTPLKREYKTSLEATRSIGAMAGALEAKGDRRAQFAHIYAITIAATLTEIERGRFANPKWVERLVVNYANLYRRTLYAELLGRRSELPVAWQQDFRLADSERWTATFDLIYGIKVHITRDLVEALYVTPTDFESESVRQDFFAITEVLQAAMPQIWEVYRRFARAMPIVSVVTEDAVSDWIGRLRAQAWMDARASHTWSAERKAGALLWLDRECKDRSYALGLLLVLH